MRWLRWFLVFVPMAIVAHFALHSETLVFAFSCAGLVPLAGLLGEATEELALHTGPKIGGLLNATLGNAAELIITIVALKAGRFQLVKASITGSILGNLLLILGASLLVGGLRHGVQRFDKGMARMSSTMLLLAVIGMQIPTLFEIVHRVEAGLPALKPSIDPSLDRLSIGVAAALIFVYVLGLVFSLKQPDRGFCGPVGVEEGEAEERHSARWSIRTSVFILLAATAGTVVLGELLVGAIEPVIKRFGISELFLGVILIPFVGNVAEHLVGVQTAWKNKMDLSLSISLGSSMQIALFVAPLLVFISLFFGKEMTLFFSPFEVVILLLSVLMAAQIANDGESNWLEGVQLLVVYVIAGLGFLWL